jgi:hypothetical protein
VVPGDVLHVMNNGNPAEVILFQTPSKSEQGLRTTGFTSVRSTTRCRASA